MSTAKKPEFTNPMAEVCLEAVMVSGKETGKVAVMVKDDDGEFQCQCFQPAGYKLLKNVTAMEIVESILLDGELSWSREGHIWNGKAASLFYKIKDPVIAVPGTEDGLSLGLVVENNYDGAYRFRISFIAYVHDQLSRLTLPSILKSFEMKFDEESGEYLATDVETCPEDYLADSADIVAELANSLSLGLVSTKLSVDTTVSLAKKVPLPGYNFAAAVRDLSEGATMWEFLKAILYQTTYKMKGASGLRCSESVGNFFCSMLETK